MQHLIYLHGFLSSRQSEKAQQTLAYVKQHYPSLNIHIPELSGNIVKAKKTIDSLMKTLDPSKVSFIGSSMGGFLSTYCLETYCVNTNKESRKGKQISKAVLINPAVTPVELLKDYMGKHINPYTGEIFYIHNNHLHNLKSMYQDQIADPSRYLVLLQTGDETLDYKLAEKKYEGSNLVIEHGGNHSFVNYPACLPMVFEFLYC